MVPRARAAVVLSVVAVLLATPTGAAAGLAHADVEDGSGGNATDASTGTGTAPTSTADTTNATPTVNRTGESTVRIRAGGEDAHLLITLDLSLFTGMPGPGRLGFASSGLLAGERVVGVELGLRFLGVGNPLTFLGNPSSRFTVEAHSELSLPFLAEPAVDGGTA